MNHKAALVLALMLKVWWPDYATYTDGHKKTFYASGIVVGILGQSEPCFVVRTNKGAFRSVRVENVTKSRWVEVKP